MNYPASISTLYCGDFSVEGISELSKKVQAETNNSAILSLKGPRNGIYSALYSKRYGVITIYAGMLQRKVCHMKVDWGAI